MDTSYNEETQRAKVGAGFKGGPFYKNPIQHPTMNIVDGVPMEVKEKSFFTPIKQSTPGTPWNASKQAK